MNWSEARDSRDFSVSNQMFLSIEATQMDFYIEIMISLIQILSNRKYYKYDPMDAM